MKSGNFKKGYKLNLGRKRSDMIGNKFAIGKGSNSGSFKKGQEPWNKYLPKEQQPSYGKPRTEKQLKALEKGRGQIKKTGNNINCNNCDKEFYVSGYGIKTGRKCCSMKCSSEFRIKNNIIEKECLQCKEIMKLKPFFTEQRKFCSNSCNSQYNWLQESYRNKNIESHLGIEPPNKNREIRKCVSCETNFEITVNSKQKYCNQICGNKEILKRKPMSGLEIKFNNIIIKNNLPYKFVGNGEFFIEKKNPDFINEEKKIAVEVFYKTHKATFLKGGFKKLDYSRLVNYVSEREKLFSKYGWITFFFDETMVNEKEVLKRLGDGYDKNKIYV
ncbi:MAG: hypothetical protein Q7R52_04375 [archaeon]|nr:hypothetical protein [archaeon]